jgi:hypothetical protein
MSDLIKALQIFLKYANPEYPTHCEHDVLYIMDITPSQVSEEDKKELEKLGFYEDYDGAYFYSFHFGSA